MIGFGLSMIDNMLSMTVVGSLQVSVPVGGGETNSLFPFSHVFINTERSLEGYSEYIYGYRCTERPNVTTTEGSKLLVYTQGCTGDGDT